MEEFQSANHFGVASFEKISKNVDKIIDKLLEIDVLSSETKSELLKTNT